QGHAHPPYSGAHQLRRVRRRYEAARYAPQREKAVLERAGVHVRLLEVLVVAPRDHDKRGRALLTQELVRLKGQLVQHDGAAGEVGAAAVVLLRAAAGVKQLQLLRAEAAEER